MKAVPDLFVLSYSFALASPLPTSTVLTEAVRSAGANIVTRC